MESLLSVEDSLVKVSPFKYKLKQLYLSNYIHLIYGLLIIITIFSIVWILINNRYHRNDYLEEIWFIALEMLLCFMVFLDLFFRIYLTGFLLFIKSFLNVLDILLTTACVAELIIALLDLFVRQIGTLIAFIILILRNVFMMIRIIILMKRSLTSKKSTPVIVHEEHKISAESLDTILETNREYKKRVYRPRLDTLGEAEEVYEDSLNQRHDVWKGRIKQG